MTNREKERIFVDRTQTKYPEVWQHYTKLVSHELFTPEELRAYNFRKRQEIVSFAYNNIIFYKELYDSVGFHPEDLKTEEDWIRIPTIDKQIVRDNFEKMLVGGPDSDLVKKYGKVCNTGGSTGKPLSLIRDIRYEQPGSTLWRTRGWWLHRTKGEVLGDNPILGLNESFVWRMKGVAVKDEKQREAEKALYHPMRRYYLDAQEMTPENMKAFVSEMKEDGVVYLRGYAGALVEFAQFCLDNNLVCKPEVCSCVSNPIDVVGRRVIFDAFGCPIYDIYGSKECQNMAHECGQSEHHLHVLSDLRHIEILDDNGFPVMGEEEGTIYNTSFTNYIMPLIRYNQGDRSHWISHTCKCGLPFPLISRIKGRESDVLVDRNGFKVFAPASPFYDVPDYIAGYQFIVHGPGNVTIKIVPNKSNPDYMKGVEYVKQYYQHNYEDRFVFDYELVDSISHDDGKLRIIVYEKQ